MKARDSDGPRAALPHTDPLRAGPSVAQVMEAVLASVKYAGVDPAWVAELAAQELAKGFRVKEAIKQVKNRLHQSVGAYWAERADFAGWLDAIDRAEDESALRATLLEIMRAHYSTRERLPILPDFYATLFADLPPIRYVLDLGCGLNLLALPWMALPAATPYFACDVDRTQMHFLAEWLAHAGRPGQAFVWSLFDSAPPTAALLEDTGGTDVGAGVALLLKTIPCLEQLDRRIGPRLLASVTAPILIVSFPAHSLGGRRKGMLEHYAAHMDALLASRAWRVERFEFASELVFRIHRGET